MSDCFIRYMPFPNSSVKAATFPNDDGTFDIYLNARYSDQELRAALRHELQHIRLGHFYSDDPVRQKENEADAPPASCAIPPAELPEELLLCLNHPVTP